MVGLYFLVFLLALSLTLTFIRHFDLGIVGGASLFMIFLGIVKFLYSYIGNDFYNISVVAGFVAMSSSRIIDNLIDVLIISFMGVIVFIKIYPYIIGFGGSLGLLAFITVGIYYIFRNIK
ncbi:MAG: hypothetical protein K6348_08925 [Deferribacterales bacterium]